MPVSHYVVAYTLHHEQDGDRANFEAALSQGFDAEPIENMETMWKVRYRHQETPGPNAARMSKIVSDKIYEGFTGSRQLTYDLFVVKFSGRFSLVSNIDPWDLS